MGRLFVSYIYYTYYNILDLFIIILYNTRVIVGGDRKSIYTRLKFISIYYCRDGTNLKFKNRRYIQYDIPIIGT